MPRLEPQGASYDEAMWEEWAESLACYIYEIKVVNALLVLVASEDKKQYIQFTRTSGRDGDLLLGEVRLGNEGLTDAHADALQELGWIEPGRYGQELGGPNHQCVWSTRGGHSIWLWQLPEWRFGVANSVSFSLRQERWIDQSDARDAATLAVGTLRGPMDVKDPRQVDLRSETFDAFTW